MKITKAEQKQIRGGSGSPCSNNSFCELTNGAIRIINTRCSNEFEAYSNCAAVFPNHLKCAYCRRCSSFGFCQSAVNQFGF